MRCAHRAATALAIVIAIAIVARAQSYSQSFRVVVTKAAAVRILKIRAIAYEGKGKI